MSLSMTQRNGFGVSRAALYALGLADPYWSSTSILLQMGGTDEVAATTDSSSYGHTISFNNTAGNAVIDTAQSVGGSFPASSLRVDATIDAAIGYAYWADNDAFTLGDDPFTWEFFFRHNGASMGATSRFIGGQVDDNAGVVVNTNSSIYAVVRAGKLWAAGFRSTIGDYIHTGNVELGGISSLTGNTWYYGCYCREGDTFRLYLGTPGGTAVQEASVAAVASGAIIVDSSAQWGMGICGEWPGLAWYNLNGSPDVSGWSGWLGPMRLTRGVCRYPGGTSYAVPTRFATNP
jgi:hypothetical protein